MSIRQGSKSELMVDLRCDSEIEVLSAADAVRRRHWSDADKLRIINESFAGQRQAATTARRYGISRSLLTVWRRQYRNGELGSEPSHAFIPVTLSLEAPVQPARTPLTSDPDARLEVVLGNGRQLVVRANIEPEALDRLLPVLQWT